MRSQLRALRSGRRTRLAACVLALAVVSTGCTMPQSTESGAVPVDEPTVATSVVEAAPPAETAGAAQATSEGETPVESFRAWFDATRAPDVDAAVACGYLTDELIERMLDELAANGWSAVTDCPTMITETAALYAAFDVDAEVRVETRSATAERAELHIVYPGGDCGSIALRPDGESWVITEQSEEQC